MNTISKNTGNQKLTRKQTELMKKILVYTLMGIICAGSFYLIFAPSADKKAEEAAQAGFNTEIPMPKEGNLIGDKRDAYEQEQMKQKQSERMRSLEDFSTLLGENVSKPADDLSLIIDEPSPSTLPKVERTTQNRPRSSIENSALAYREINRSLGSFYEKPREDPEKEKLKRELEELKARIDESENHKNAVDNQLELMEKSFQMASGYIPGTVETTGRPADKTIESKPATTGNVSGDAVFVPVDRVRETTVSILQSEMTDAEFIASYGQLRNTGFLSPSIEALATVKNTIMACIHTDQVIMDGQNVRLRLYEPFMAGSITIPRNTVLSGISKIRGERLEITVNSLMYNGMVIPVELRVYDTDGQRGIFIPNLNELNAAKEIIANMGTSAGSNISLSNDAGKQFAADMGRNVIQGASQFAAKKLREVKVYLKAGYIVYLFPEGNMKNSRPLLASNK